MFLGEKGLQREMHLFFPASPLQRRIKTNDGTRTIAGLGNWEGWINSAEMDNAMKFGYTFEILKGSQFETGDILSKYINKMYNLRLNYPRGNEMNLIAKLLMISLYGKFGMKLEKTRVEIEKFLYSFIILFYYFNILFNIRFKD